MLDVDWTVESKHKEYQFKLDKVKASLNYIDTVSVVQTLRLALSGLAPGTVHVKNERNPLMIQIILSRIDRSDIERLYDLKVKGMRKNLVSLREIGEFKEVEAEKTIYHKNLKPIVYVQAEIVGRTPAEAILNLQSHFLKTHSPPTFP